MKQTFFSDRPDIHPKIYAYTIPTDTSKNGLLKVGYTTKLHASDRIDQQLKTARLDYSILVEEDAVRDDGSDFSDHDIHRRLESHGHRRVEGERFACQVDDVLAAIHAIKHRTENESHRHLDFSMRPEQQEAVTKTSTYFRSLQGEKSDHAPRFLRNAKMRFGKTFTAYQLALEMGRTKVLVLTFKPAVEKAREEDLMQHQDFEGRQFISKKNANADSIDEQRPFVCFGSFQDYLGRNQAGGIKAKNERVHDTQRDVIIFDEYHYGARREGATALTNEDEKDDTIGTKAFEEGVQQAEEIMPISTDHYLYLSGTPFRALGTGEFIEEQIFNRTYSNEQERKTQRNTENGPNPYLSLPKIVMMTYKIPESVSTIAQGGEFDEFDLNIFFSAEGEGKDATFKHKDEVQKRLDFIRGSLFSEDINVLKLGKQKPAFPFSDSRLLNTLTHTFRYMPKVASCHAMKNLMQEKQNTFYHDYNIIIAAGKEAGIGVKALGPVQNAMANPLHTKTITLSCGKLTTGVSVKPRSGIFMLRNLQSPESYFQTAFRAQTPRTITNPDGKSPNQKSIMKEICYIFDFAPNRALRQITDYSSKLNPKQTNRTKGVEDFIKFLPVIAYDGSSMREVDATGILDMVASGTNATLLAKRRESALLVNVDNDTLARLLSTPQALETIMKIEGFRRLNDDLETIINKSESVKEAKKEANEKDITPTEKKQISEDEKEYKSKRKQIQEKLIKFATRIPIFMYLTDNREESLQDVITQIEPGLFKQVTGLSVEDFELLVSLNLFNGSVMNDAVWKFKTYENASLEYTGINKHKDDEKVGLYNTIVSKEEHEKEHQGI